MEYELVDNALSAPVFLSLCQSVGWNSFTKYQAVKGLEKDLYDVIAVRDGQAIGMGRLVGDGFTIWYMQNVAVLPEFQGKGVGKAIVKRLIAFAEASSLPDTFITIGLMSAKGKDDFYKKLGFRARPTEREGAGMVMNIQIKG